MRHDSSEGTPTPARRPYHAPTLRSHGTVQEQTQAELAGGGTDGIYAGNAPIS